MLPSCRHRRQLFTVNNAAALIATFYPAETTIDRRPERFRTSLTTPYCHSRNLEWGGGVVITKRRSHMLKRALLAEMFESTTPLTGISIVHIVAVAVAIRGAFTKYAAIEWRLPVTRIGGNE